LICGGDGRLLAGVSSAQDELEFGYIDSPHQRFPVVLDSPRDRGLADFPYDELLVRNPPCLRNSHVTLRKPYCCRPV